MIPVTRLTDICTGHSSWIPRPNAEASEDVFVNNLGVHREGDAWQQHPSNSPNPPHGGNLASGSSTVFINGKQCGRIGDPVDCGSAVATGSPDVYCGD